MEEPAGFLLEGLERVIPAKAGIQNFTAIQQNWNAACGVVTGFAIRLKSYRISVSVHGREDFTTPDTEDTRENTKMETKNRKCR